MSSAAWRQTARRQDALTRCSCSIDQIATILPYDDYVEAETVLQHAAGARRARGDVPRHAGDREIAADLRRAQAEAEILCF